MTSEKRGYYSSKYDDRGYDDRRYGDRRYDDRRFDDRRYDDRKYDDRRYDGRSYPTGHSQQYGQPAGYGHPGTQHGYPANTVVVQQHPPQYAVQGGHRPSDYLILSIISIFFCWPMAICAIVYSCNSKSSSDTGDYVRAESQGRTARNIGIAAIVLGVIIIAVAVAVPLVLGAAVVASVCSGFDCTG